MCMCCSLACARLEPTPLVWMREIVAVLSGIGGEFAGSELERLGPLREAEEGVRGMATPGGKGGLRLTSADAAGGAEVVDMLSCGGLPESMDFDWGCDEARLLSDGVSVTCWLELVAESSRDITCPPLTALSVLVTWAAVAVVAAASASAVDDEGEVGGSRSQFLTLHVGQVHSLDLRVQRRLTGLSLFRNGSSMTQTHKGSLSRSQCCKPLPLARGCVETSDCAFCLRQKEGREGEQGGPDSPSAVINMCRNMSSEVSHIMF